MSSVAEARLAVRTSTHDWVIAVGRAPVLAGRRIVQTHAADGTGVTVTVPGEADAAPIAWGGDRALVLFAGELQNRRELEALAPGGAHGGTAAELLVVLVGVYGPRIAERLRGTFAMFAWDRRTGAAWAARDQIGIHPLYYAITADAVLFAASIDALTRQPGVSRALSPIALSEYLTQRYAVDEETFYRDVRRCLPAHRVIVDDRGVRSERYWDPLPDGQPVSWLRDEEVEAFEGIFTRAVERAAGSRAAAIFLSGGLDSISVAAVADDVCSREGAGRLLGLSLGFEDPDSDERPVQRQVAERLGIEQVLIPFRDAVQKDRFIQTALRMGADWPIPMWNVWSPAYASLVQAGLQRGRATVLTGRGGDEWLTVSPFHAADLARSGNFFGLAHLVLSRNRSRRHTGAKYALRLLRDRVARPLGSAALATVAPRWWHERRRARLNDRVPSWLAPDAALRADMNDRLDRFIIEARPRDSFYVRETRTTLRHPCVTGDLEEAHEFGRRCGVEMRHPFWDVDLVEFLCRVPPRFLDAGGRSKAPLRRMVARRFPALGVERQKKAHAVVFFDSMMRAESPAIWRASGGLQALRQLGVVDAPAARAYLDTLLQGPFVVDPGRVFEVLTLETWARHKMN
jgi:asparagine synthase (glutamine-hydrolysing)